MQRLTARRRHRRAGSVTVAELLKKQPVPMSLPPSSHSAVRSCDLDELLGPPAEPGEVDPDEPRQPGNVAKLVGLAAGALVLCGSVAAAAVISDHRAVNPFPQPLATPPLEITGAGALRPDMLGAQLAGAGGPPPAAVQPAGPLPGLAVAPDADPAGGPAATTAPASSAVVAPRTSVAAAPGAPAPLAAGSGGPAGQRPGTPVGVVQEFYRLLGQQPDAASALLAPELRDADPTGFAQSWASVLALRLERAEQRDDQSVLAIVAIQRRDGSWLRVEQVLRLSATRPPQIIGAEILAAQVDR
ncbi:hypothetical protein [Gandjariella thermophila]|uniref:hypothetical protein n=1 Tax=Gandjariella thermophila TaxID=1931992 RepID=UPI0010F7307E|nr:hypothetical protein [Gandjariella thermophila]